MATRTFTAAVALLAMSSCVGGYQPSSTPGPRPVAFADCPSQVLKGDHFECIPSPATTQVATVAPPASRPQRTALIEYVDSQPMVRIEVPGVESFRCVLDTGSSDLVIPGWLLLDMHDKYGLPDSDWSVIGTGSAELANGSRAATYHIKFREIAIGPWRLTNVPAFVSLSSRGLCLLGMSVLKAFGHPMIDFANQRLVLED